MKNNHHRFLIYSTTLLLVCLNISAISIILDLPAIAQPKIDNKQRGGKSTNTIPVDPNTPKSESSNPNLRKSDAQNNPEESDKKAKLLSPSNNNFDFWLIINGLAVLLHILEIAGLGGLFALLKKSNEQKDDRIYKLTDKVNSLEEKIRIQSSASPSNNSDSVTIQNLTYRLQAIEKQLTLQQQERSTTIPQQQNYPPPRVEPHREIPAPPPLVKSRYAFLDLYKQNPEAFKSQYSAIKVSENEENLQKRWAGQQQNVILEETRKGNYWLINERGIDYLVPIPTLKITEINMGTVGELFECKNYHPNYQSVNIIQPAIVSNQTGTIARWKLEQKGILEFT